MGERSQRQKSGNEWSEIPAETPYLAPCRKRAVCKGWVVEKASRAKLVSDGYQGKIQGKNEKSPQKSSGEAPRAQY
jgi:hypothetical protein